MPHSMDIGQTKQLFLDDAIVEEMDQVSRTLNRPTKHPGNPLLPAVPELASAWDAGLVSTFASVLFDGEEKCFKMWYGLGGIEGGDEEFALAYATSQDGTTWHKPTLGLASFQGTTANNIVLPKDGCGTSVFKDLRETDPARRYKMLLRYQVCAAHSADGLRWTEYNRSEPVMAGGHDGHNLAYWDEGLGKYVAILRDRQGFIAAVRPELISDPEGRRGWKKLWDPEYNRAPENHTLRRIGQAESNDFVHWTPMRCIVGAAAADPLNEDQFYNMEVLQYAGLRIGLMTVFSCDPDYSRAGVQLVCSRDGMNWDRVADRAVFLAPGEREEFDWGRIYPAQAPLVVGDEIWIYYVGDATDHLEKRPPDAAAPAYLNGIGLARLRLDGFVSVDAGDQGSLTTRPFTFAGDKLVVNAAAGDGQIAVEVQEAEGKAVPGFARQDCIPLTGDEIRHQVSWKERRHLQLLAGRSIRLKFYLQRARLFSFKFAR